MEPKHVAATRFALIRASNGSDGTPSSAGRDDALADILRRLPPRDLAASRCVRKAWRAVVDDNRLLLPRTRCTASSSTTSTAGARTFKPAPPRPAINGNFLPGDPYDFDPVVDHCNGLVLYGAFRAFCVANPATRRWDNLPRRRDDSMNCHACLVFDPAVSPPYEVFSVPDLPQETGSCRCSRPAQGERGRLCAKARLQRQ
ncbi:LOW QUALITY PROTEIN: hypothetical protein BRADI_1g66163v3 [Brachypodium distachyon]|uniref:F-box domain-containing protein n=1 Tax=Brachypodium distachyon TaxID=15368 RepID=A0A2K2DTM6_BRADI|nr:LOW QUALITY PROTEIN: hypothetical protein BRADI_1g66163v3 [Brachypodium distachyon]